MTLLEVSAMGAVLIGSILLLRKLVSDRLPPWCYLLLWLLAALRLLLPMHITSSWSIYRWIGNLMPDTTILQETEAYIPVVHETFEWMTGTAVIPADMTLTVDWLAVLWCVGAVACFAYAVIQHWRSRIIYNTSIPVEYAAVQQWQSEHLLYRKYRIRQSQQIDAPLTYGVFCPVILLPTNPVMSAAQLKMVLLHEWNHIRHWDVLWQWLLLVVCSVHWFNPFVWIMFVYCRQDLELFCDYATVQAMQPTERSQYAFLLLQQTSTGMQIMPSFNQFSFTGYHRMEERVKTIMKQKPSTWKTGAVSAVLLCVGFFGFATSAAGEPVVATGEGLQLQWPITSKEAVITMEYGIRVHPITGMEMKMDHISIGGVETGAEVIAAASGVIKEAGFDTQYGYYLLIAHDNGIDARYWHCQELLVSEGDTVSAGQVIATLGQTGDATGPCLSFAAYKYGEAVDPMTLLEPK